jgi:hypothetical protein
MFVLHFDLEDEGSMFFRNIDERQSNYVVPHCKNSTLQRQMHLLLIIEISVENSTGKFETSPLLATVSTDNPYIHPLFSLYSSKENLKSQFH